MDNEVSAIDSFSRRLAIEQEPGVAAHLRNAQRGGNARWNRDMEKEFAVAGLPRHWDRSIFGDHHSFGAGQVSEPRFDQEAFVSDRPIQPDAQDIRAEEIPGEHPVDVCL